MSWMIHLPVLVPLPLFILAFIGFLLGLWRPYLSYYTAILATAGAFFAACTGLVKVFQTGPLTYSFGGWVAPFGIEYNLDGLSALMAVIVTFFGFIITLYARRPIRNLYHQHLGHFYTLILLLLAGLTGIVITGDLFNLFVFLEISSLCTYALVASGGGRATVAAFRYLLLGSLGGSLYLLGVGFLFFKTGTLNMEQMATLLPELWGDRAILTGAALIITGLGVKAALFPLHLWLPDAYAFAPPPVSALIASMMTKVGIYAIIRYLFWIFGHSYVTGEVPFTTWIALLSLLGIIVTSYRALPENSYRRLLAYSSVSQVAYIGLGIGLASPLGLAAALLHIINHAVLKACLFLTASNFQFGTGKENIEDFPGIGQTMPWSAAAATLAGLSLIGIPPTGGFFSKWYLIQAALEQNNWIALIVIIIGSLLAVAYVFRFLNRIYLVEPLAPPEDLQEREVPMGMLVPTLVLAVGTLVTGLLNPYILPMIMEYTLPGAWQ